LEFGIWELEFGSCLIVMDIAALADELTNAYATRTILPVPLSSREAGFDLATAYAIEAELTRRRRDDGHKTVGRKVGFANKAMWRVLKLDTLVWAHIYDHTVIHTVTRDPGPGARDSKSASLSLGRMVAPKIEPEIVFKLRTPVDTTNLDAAAVLSSVEWLALGFEIVDCVFADWTFQPADFVAAYGLHAALVVGEPRALTADSIPTLVEQLAQFKVRLSRNGEQVAEGSGRNSLRSPALCLGELASAISRRSPQELLAGGELVSSGTLTEAPPIAPGETWTATLEGLDLSDLTLTTTA
jgi:2-oxo-3-hexenedioate decarboxylase